jgi:hypothetical protein
VITPYGIIHEHPTIIYTSNQATSRDGLLFPTLPRFILAMEMVHLYYHANGILRVDLYCA